MATNHTKKIITRSDFNVQYFEFTSLFGYILRTKTYKELLNCIQQDIVLSNTSIAIFKLL